MGEIMKDKNAILKGIKEKLFRCHFEIHELYPWEVSLLKHELTRVLQWHMNRGLFKGKESIDALEAYALLKIWKRFGLSLDGFRELLETLEQFSYDPVPEVDRITVAA
jgi:hypothetical protein